MASTTDLVSDSVPDFSGENGTIKKEKPFKEMGLSEKWVYIREFITIEPMLCLFQLASIMAGSAVYYLPLEMACRVNAQFNDTICKSMIDQTFFEKGFKEEYDIVQKYLLDADAWSVPFQTAVPVILLLFLGTFSDRYKIRKPFFLIPICGEFFSCISCILCVWFIDKWPVEVQKFAQIIVPSFLGSPHIFNMAALAYIADVSTREMRVVRLSALQVCMNIWSPLGSVVSGALWDVMGYTKSFILTFVFFLLAFLYAIFFVKEPRESTDKLDKKTLIKHAFNPQHIMETLKLLIKVKGNQRMDLIFIVGIYFMFSVILSGEGFLFQYFVQGEYQWSGPQLQYYIALYGVVGCIGLVIGVPLLSKALELKDLILIVVFSFDKILFNIVVIVVSSSCGLYMAMVTGILLEVGIVALNSQASKYVLEEDIGKTMSLLAITSAVGSNIGIQLYNKGIYQNTSKTHIYTYFYFSILLILLTVPLVIWKYLSERKRKVICPEGQPEENGTEMQEEKI